MYTQQEMNESIKLYNAYKDQRILFSSNVSQNLGLKQHETMVKIGSDTIKGALVSASMDDMVLLTRMKESLRKKLSSNESLITVQLKFYDSLFKKEMGFTLHTSFLNMNNSNLSHEDFQYLSVKLKRQMPHELISVFGKHHKTAEKNKIEAMLFTRGIKKSCMPIEVRNNTIEIRYSDDPTPFLYQKAMIVLKSSESGEVFEVIGKIDGNCIKENESYRLSLIYSIDQQSPRFSQSIESLKKTIN